MLKIYKTEEQIIEEREQLEEGVWVQMTSPSMEESQKIADYFDIDITDIRAALDDEESSRIELEDGYTLILVDIPSIRGQSRCADLYYSPARYPAHAGRDHYRLHRGNAGAAAFCEAQGAGFQHEEEEDALCLSDPVSDGGALSERSAHY